jgi:hypothetical protein
MEKPQLRLKSDMLRALGWICLIWIVYVGFTLMAPATQAVSRYGLTLTQANILRIAIVLPVFFIWITVLFSVVRFRRYTGLVVDSPEEMGFRKITKGLFMLLLVIVVPGFVTVFATYYPHSELIQQVCIIIRNYLTIIFYMAGFIYLWQASRHLLRTVKGIDWGEKYRTITLAGVGALTFIYTWFIFQNDYRSSSNDPLVLPTYGLPDILIILTIVIPYLLIWLFGSMAVLNMWSYAKEVPGIIYRQTFKSLAEGLTVTVILLIGLQFLSQANASLSHSTLKVILVIIYLLLLLIAAGYLMIARGAGKLAAIEEIE